MSQTARDIAWRYQCDISDLNVHLQFVSWKTAITDAAIAELNLSLQTHGFATIAQRTPNKWGYETPYSPAESANSLETLEAVYERVWKREYALTGENFRLLEARSRNTWEAATENAIQIAVGVFPCNLPSDDELAIVRETVAGLLQGQVDENGDAIDVDHVVMMARYRKRFTETRLLQELGGRLRLLCRAAASYHPDKQNSLYRQSFILLMTHFDSTVFDLVRLALKTNFFQLAARFGEKEKFAFAKFGEHRDFESLRNSLIADLLKSRYVKTLLFELKDLGVEPVDDQFGGFKRLIELVLRRNVHLHNRGFVDTSYLESKRGDKSEWNLDGLTLGKFASIDETYFGNASGACGQYINILANWVTAGAVPNASS